MSQFSSLRHYLRPLKWRVRLSAGSTFRPSAKLRYSFEPQINAESTLCAHTIAAQPTRELQPDFTSIPDQQLPPPSLLLATPDLNWDNMPGVAMGWPRDGHEVAEGWLRWGFTTLVNPEFTGEIIFFHGIVLFAKIALPT